MANDPKSNPAGDGEQIDATSASSGQKTGYMRWVLVIGTLLAIIGMALLWVAAVPH